MEDFRRVAGNGVALHHASDTCAGHQSEDGKTDCKRFAVHCALHDIHRTAADETVLADKPVFNREESFSVFCCDSENAAEPAPEHRAGTAEDDRGCHTDDVSGSDGCRQRNGECAVVGDLADRIRIFLKTQTDRQRNVPLDEFEAEGEKEVTSDEQYQERNAPEKRVEGADKVSECFHHFPLLLSVVICCFGGIT